jgi:hypothetical protein
LHNSLFLFIFVYVTKIARVTLIIMKKNKKINGGKEIALPYFLINSTGELQSYALGGYLDENGNPIPEQVAPKENPLSGMGSAFAGAGDIISTGIGGNEYTAEGRPAAKGKQIGSGIASGAGTGASIGTSIMPGWGTLIGGVVGGIAGGIGGSAKSKKEVSMFKQSLEDNPIDTTGLTTKYYGAYGGELPEFAMGGDLNDQDPPDKAKTVEDYQKERMRNDAYTQAMHKEMNRISRMQGDKEIANTQDSTIAYKGGYYNDTPTTMLLNENSLLRNEGTSRQNPELSKQEAYSIAQGTANKLQQAGQGGDGYYKYNDTIYKRTGDTWEKKVNNKYVPLTKGDIKQRSEVLNKGAKFFQTFALGGELPEFALGGDLMEMAGDGTEYNGNTHAQGGIQIGKSEVEDGEVRVGNYVFSDRLSDPTTSKTFAEEAKKVLKKFEEYENDGPSMRTQDKMLKELKASNDQARELKKQEDEAMKAMMGEDFKAFGGMIKQADNGNYIVDKKDRLAILDGAKNRKMGYNAYIDNLFKYGGDLENQMAWGGGIDPNDKYGADPMNVFTPPNIVGQGYTGVEGPLTNSPEYMDLSGDMGNTIEGLPQTDLSMPYNDNPNNVNTPMGSYEDYIKGVDPATTDTTEKVNPTEAKRFGTEEKALLASELPALGNIVNSFRPTNTNFERLKLDEISLDAERQAVERSISKARNITRENVRGNATSAGEALAAMSAGNAGLTQSEMSALQEITQRETNLNVGVNNQEASVNNQIANQEMVARQQDEAMKASVRNMAIANLSNNAQGYLKDKSLNKENEAANKRLLSLLKTGEYEMESDGKDGFKITYKKPAEVSTNTKTN